MFVRIGNILFLLILFSSFVSAKPQEEFSNVYTFGDSFSYEGTWTEFLMQRYGIKYIKYQNGFAEGGGKTFDLPTQLANYEANVKGFDGNALYIAYMGPSDAADSHNTLTDDNDFIIRLGYGYELANFSNTGLSFDDFKREYNNGAFTFAQLFPITYADIQSRANAYGNFIKQISEKGAKYIVVFKQFNDTLRQRTLINDDAEKNGPRFWGRVWVNEFNKVVSDQIAIQAPSANVIFVDLDRLITELASKPNFYFTSEQILGTVLNEGLFVDAHTSPLYAHATPPANKLFSQYVASIIESPSRIAMLRESVLSFGTKLFHHLGDLGYNFARGGAEERVNVQLLGDYTYARSGALTHKELGFKKSDAASGQVMVNMLARDNLVIGGVIGKNINDIKFAKNHGKARIDEVNFAVHSVYRIQSSFLYGSVGMGSLQYSIRRDIPLGIGINSERGKPKGRHYMAIIGAGYNKNLKESLSLIPYVNLNYQTVSMKAYKEKGSLRSTTMTFKIPDRRSLVTEIGVSLEGKMQIKEKIQANPFLTISYNYDFMNPIKKQAKAVVSDMPRYFSVPTYKTNPSSLYVQGGIKGMIKNNIVLTVNAGTKPIGRIKEYSAGLSIVAGF